MSAKYIVTHKSCDLDGITSVWLLKRFFPGWSSADVLFVPAGEKLPGVYEKEGEAIEKVDGKEVIHVDTGMGMLDHHQFDDKNVCAASLTLDFILSQPHNLLSQNLKKQEVARRMVEVVIGVDHFQEVFLEDPLASSHDFSLVGIIDGLKFQYPGDDKRVMEFGIVCLDALLHTFENKMWAEKEIEEKGIEFDTKWGKGMAIETANDTVLKLAQKMGYVIAVRKDPKQGSLRIKARPKRRVINYREKEMQDITIDLTFLYEKLKKMDPSATWFLHSSKRMLLNGSSKNPTMRGTTVSLREVITLLS